MIHLGDAAKKELDAFFEGKETSPVRVYLAPGGWSGPRLALALDKPENNDATFENNSYTFIIENALLEQVKSVTIDFSYMGFTVEPEVPLSGGGCGSSCGSSCSTGTCG